MKLGEIRRAGARGDEIDIGPLIDIIFILLIFFMVSTTFVRNLEVDIERPSAGSAALADARAIRVAIDQGGSVYLEGQPIQPWMVQSRVRDLLAADRRRPVLITADQRLETGRLIDVVDQCRLAGAKHVAVDAELEPRP
ncbi:biopolymer transporter ExbD [Myxococcota bacterium]|nr:biopolymer transporter ExbD [Myxococcota bacterium]MBU1429248.1 biopolymer transporter ExbD [Myxococcota bacterium]MBU1898640.1 biopolymer transporter ExbD [Myxococcota bacterium]